MLADYQDALALLLVEPELRARVGDPAVDWSGIWAGRDLDLDPDEIESLRGLDPVQLERAAEGLLAKRIAAMRATTPRTAGLWPDFSPCLRRLLLARPPRVEQLQPALGPGPSQLLSLRVDLHRLLRADTSLPAWAPDLFQLELARACTRRDARPRQLECSHAVHRVLELLDAGWLSLQLEPLACAYLVESDTLHWRAVETRA